MEDWKDIPTCFGKENKDNMKCGQCEVMHDCLFLRSIRVTEKTVSQNIPHQSQTVTIPVEEMLKMQSSFSWEMWRARMGNLLSNDSLKNMMDEIIKQGFNRDEALAIMIKLI